MQALATCKGRDSAGCGNSLTSDKNFGEVEVGFEIFSVMETVRWGFGLTFEKLLRDLLRV